MVLVLLVGVGATGVAATEQSTSPSFVVQLAEDGSATVTLTLTKDLETDSERTAFRTLQNDSEARADTRTRFRDRMASVARDASNATGREMTVGDATIDLSTTDGGSVGVIALSVTWTKLAATEGDSLVVTEPFASGFEPDRRFTVRGPAGYELASATPSPDDESSNAATWSAGSDLSGFEATFEPSPGGTTGGGGGDDGSGSGGIGVPGFGVGVALAALSGAALALGRRR